MDPIAPADFYTGLVAELYAALRSSDPDPAPYARFVARSGTPALELGCGDERDEMARRQTTLLRYDRERPGKAPESTERPWTLHWYSPAGVSELARRSGLDVVQVADPTGAPADDDSDLFSVVLVRNPRPGAHRESSS